MIRIYNTNIRIYIRILDTNILMMRIIRIHDANIYTNTRMHANDTNNTNVDNGIQIFESI